jgi:hypothetical protein
VSCYNIIEVLLQYSFRKTIQDPRHGEFEHPNFKQGNPDKLVYIKRKLNSNSPTLLRAKAAAAAAAATAAAENPVTSSLMIPATENPPPKTARRSRSQVPTAPLSLNVAVDAAVTTPTSMPEGIAATRYAAVPFGSAFPVPPSVVTPPAVVHGKGLRNLVAARGNARTSQFQQNMQQQNMFNAASLHNPHFGRVDSRRFVSDQFDVDADDFDSFSIKNENGKRNASESILAPKRSLIEEDELDIDLEMLMNMSVDDSLNEMGMDTFMGDNNDSDIELDFPQEEVPQELLMQLSDLEQENKDKIDENFQLRSMLESSQEMNLKLRDDISTMMKSLQDVNKPATPAKSMSPPPHPAFARYQAALKSSSPANSDYAELMRSAPSSANSSQVFTWGEEQIPRKDSFSSRSVLGDVIGLSRNTSVEDWGVSEFLDIDFDAPYDETASNVGMPL